MTPLQRAAQALCELDGNPPGATMDGKPLWADYLPEARAVLTAIRDPSEAMVAAGSAGGDWPHAAQTWRDMIDAALAEGERWVG